MIPRTAVNHDPGQARPAATLHPRRILVRSLNWIGDAVMATPALMRLREAHSTAEIALLTHEKFGALWERHAGIDARVTYADADSTWAIARRLRRERYDAALIFPNSFRSALEIWLAGIPCRIGYSRPGRDLFLTHALPPPPGFIPTRKRTEREIRRLISGVASRPEYHPVPLVHEYLHLATGLGADSAPLPPALEVDAAESDAAARRFGIITGGMNAPIFGLNAGAAYGPAKCWPVERFIAAAKAIQQCTNCVWLIFGGKGDVQLASQIAAAIHDSRFTIHDLSGQTSLRELMALLKLCHVLLTNDSGPMHVAAALGTPVVVPFGSTSPELTGPGSPGDARHKLLQSDAPCAPCFLRECPIDFRCMNGISVGRVVEAVLEIHRQNAGTPG